MVTSAPKLPFKGCTESTPAAAMKFRGRRFFFVGYAFGPHFRLPGGLRSVPKCHVEMEGAQERISSVPAACPGSSPVPNINMYAIYMSYFSSIRWVKTSKQAKKNGGRDMTDPNPANLQQPNFAPVGSECMPDRTPELLPGKICKRFTR